MVRDKFEFRKLELPNTKFDICSAEYSASKEFSFKTVEERLDTAIAEKKNQKKPSKLIYIVLSFAFLATIAIFIYSSFPIVTAKTIAQKPIKTDTIATIKSSKALTNNKLVYLNYHDSIVFLNDVKGVKQVVSKGFDDYLKKERIIIKSENNYFNCFCNDLIENYNVGDLIP